MKKTDKTRKRLLNGTHQLLSAKDILNQLLKEGETFPKEVKEAISNARDISWRSFVAEQEKKHSTA